MADLNDPTEGVNVYPDYNPATWALGYQQRQFGVAADPLPTGVTAGESDQFSGMPYPSAYSALANPPGNMTTAIEMALPAAPDITPDQ
jgi:hypothetical protein